MHESDSDADPEQLEQGELQRSATHSAARSAEFSSLREDVSSARMANEQVVKKLQASLQRSELEALASRAEASQLREAQNVATEQLEVAVAQREAAVRQREAAATAVLEEEERAAVARRETEARLRDEAQHEAARRRELESRLREAEAALEEQKAAAAASLSTSIASLTDPSRASPERRAGGSATSPESTALTTASAAARFNTAASGGGGALLADHAQLTQQFHVLKRRFDAVVADKGRLQAEAAKRDRELQREAAALRSALLAAGAAGGRGGAAAAAAAPHYLAATTAVAAPSPSLSPPSGLRGGGGGGGSTPAGGADGAGRRGGGAEAEAEASSLRRRVSDLSADNALLTQNFMMVKARLSDVCAQKEAALSEIQLSCTQLEATLHARLAAAMRAQQAILRSELRSIEEGHRHAQHLSARRALRVCLHGLTQAGLTAALWRWHRGICALRRADAESLSTSAAASKHSALQLLGRRLVSAANVVRGAREAVGLSHALRRWASVTAGEALREAARERTRRHDWSFERLAEVQARADEEELRARREASKASEAAAAAKRLEAELQQLRGIGSQRERLQLQGELNEAARAHRALEEARASHGSEAERWAARERHLQAEREQMQQDLALSQARIFELQQHDAQQHAFEERERLRTQLHDAHRERELERQVRAQAQAAADQLQTQLQTQAILHSRSAVGEQRARLPVNAAAADALGGAWRSRIAQSERDSQLAFSVDLMNFARHVGP